jgi:hypothetical protein
MSATPPIAVADALVGAAIPRTGRLRLAAADPCFPDLDDAALDSPAPVRRLAAAMPAVHHPVPSGVPAAGRVLPALRRGRRESR